MKVSRRIRFSEKAGSVCTLLQPPHLLRRAATDRVVSAEPLSSRNPRRELSPTLLRDFRNSVRFALIDNDPHCQSLVGHAVELKSGWLMDSYMDVGVILPGSSTDLPLRRYFD